MHHVLVRNTFLDVAVSDDLYGGAARSHRAFFSSEPNSPRERSPLPALGRATVDNCNGLLRHMEQEGGAKVQGLKQVLSSMSISTMASSQDEDLVVAGAPSVSGRSCSTTPASRDVSSSGPWSSEVTVTTDDECSLLEPVVTAPPRPPSPLVQQQQQPTALELPAAQAPQGAAQREAARPRRRGSSSGSGPSVAGPFAKEFTHCRVPRRTPLGLEGRGSPATAASEASDDPQPEPTTMMVRNLPNRYTQRDLIEELEWLGFGGRFDFLYAPTDFGTMGNVGYAFINFRDAAWASRCRSALEGYVFTRHQKKNSKKAATVSVAHLQGLQANCTHYEHSAVASRARSKQCGPVVMANLFGAL